MMKKIFDLFETETYKSKLSRVLIGDFRLNAEYYSHDNNFEAVEGFEKTKLSNLADVVGFGPFKRYYIDEPIYGIPLISSSDMMELETNCDKYISKEFTKDINKYLVKRNTILLSCSGTIGNVTLVDSRLDGMGLSQHALRVIPKDEIYTGFLYTFFNSDFGQSLITGKKSGAVIDEIYDEDIKQIEIPLIDKESIGVLNSKIMYAVEKRELASSLIAKARKLVLEHNHLPPLDSIEPETLDPEKVTEMQLVSTEEFTADYRLDAHFYNPQAALVVKNIRENSSPAKLLFEVSDCLYRGGRSSRNYVAKDHGVPFLSGKNIIQIRPDLKYLSKTETNNLEDLSVHRNWILITRSGTLGRTVFIWKNYENYTASEHLIRVIPDSDQIDEAYLYAFLSSNYGYHQLLRYKHGSVIDEITEDQISQSLIPIPEQDKQKEIGEMVRQAYVLRAESIRLEDEAQEILTKELTGK